MQEYIGKEIIGFKFENTNYIGYDNRVHGKYLLKIGIIVDVVQDNIDGDHSCRVEFSNGFNALWYPMHDIDKYIHEPIKLNELFKTISMI